MTTNLIETMAQAFRDLQFGSHTGDPNKARARAALAAIEAAGYRVIPLEFVEEAQKCGVVLVGGEVANSKVSE